MFRRYGVRGGSIKPITQLLVSHRRICCKAKMGHDGNNTLIAASTINSARNAMGLNIEVHRDFTLLLTTADFLYKVFVYLRVYVLDILSNEINQTQLTEPEGQFEKELGTTMPGLLCIRPLSLGQRWITPGKRCRA